MGLMWGEDAARAIARGEAGSIAGSAVAFTHGEVIRREDGRIERSTARFPELSRSSDRATRDLLARIMAPRPAIAGLDLSAVSVMGIVNVTPDSFSDGNETPDVESAIAKGSALAEEGATILDVGGESTRPGSSEIGAEEERARVIPVVAELRRRGHLVSIDTRKPLIMREAVEAGATIINDVSALRFDAESLPSAIRLGRPVVLMHAKGDPKTMQVDPTYEDVVLDVYDFLAEAIATADAAGLARSSLLADPGIGFGKTFRHNLEILNALSLYHGLGVPLVVGASRKAFIGALTGEKTARKRVAGSIATAVAAASQGAQILRVHDVRQTVEALKVWKAVADPSKSGL